MNLTKNTILVIASHPDDEVLGVGGTIAWYSKIRKDDVYVQILTEGCSSQYKSYKTIIKKKKLEAEKANKVLGVKDVYFEELPDMRLDSLLHVELNQVIKKRIDAIRPDIVFTQHPDINNDHVLTFESTMVALRPVPGLKVRKVYTYAPASSTEWSPSLSNRHFRPNTFQDISETLEYKIEAFQCYATEMREYPHPRTIEAIRTYAKRDGITVGFHAAEPFVLIRSLES